MRKANPQLGPGLLFFAFAAVVAAAPTRADEKTKTEIDGSYSAGAVWTVPGKTQCLASRKGVLAPAVLHPVVKIMAAVGDTVKKDQPLVQLDDDEPQADVRLKKALLENTGIAMREAKRYLVSLEKLEAKGAVSEQRIHDARASALKAEADERAAKAAVDASMAELEHFIVPSPIDGVVNRLDVYLGMVSRPGTTVWGEVLDTKELDIRIQLTPAQIERVKVGDQAEIMKEDKTATHGAGRLVFISLEANSATGSFPALVRFDNREGKLRCEMAVQVRFRQ